MKKDNNYSLQDWIDGKPEPEPIDLISKDDFSIHFAKRTVFELSLEIDIRTKKMMLDESFLEKLEYSDRIEYLSLEIKKTESYLESLNIDKQRILAKDFSTQGITAKNYHFVPIGYENGLGCDLSFLKDNSIFQGRSSHQYLKYLKSLMKKYTEKIDVEQSNQKEKGETVAVKYYLQDHFFSSKPEFGKLKVGTQEEILGYIFGCRPDTAKSIKNHAHKPIIDGKHITDEGKDRFNDLLKKIKKGG
jgi:hypothetical protein